MDQPHWLERFLGGTRRRVVELLLPSDRTVQEIADEIGVSANAIRGHLSALERDGIVVQRGVHRDTGGKPATVYALSQDADELFPKAYAFVLGGLLDVIEDREGSEGVRRTLAEVGARAARPTAGSERARVEAAAEVLRSLGAPVEVRRESGHWRLQGVSCPLSAVTSRDARACGLVEALVGETTGGSVVEVCERGRRSRCAFDISFPPEGSDERGRDGEPSAGS